MSKTDSTPTDLTLMVIEEEDELDYDVRPWSPQQPGGVSAQIVNPLSVLRRRVARPKNVTLNEVKGQLDTIQGQLESLLTGLPNPKVSDFRLREVEVGLSVSGEGSIGIATVGAEISLSLKFVRE
jgi:hypothetical protein